MKILVIIKQVPDTEAQLKVNSSKTDIDKNDLKLVINPYDEYAIEEAVRLKEKNGGEVTVVTVGTAKAKEALITAMAIGADNAVLITDDLFQNLDCLTVSNILFEAVKNENYEIIFCGKQAIDDDMGQVGASLAALLNIPFVSSITKFDLDGKTAKVEREIEIGKEILEVSLPCVLSAQKGLNEPRLPSLMRMMKAKKQEIKELNSQTIGLTREGLELHKKVETIELSTPPSKSGAKILQGEPAEIIAELVKILKDDIKVIKI